MTLEDECKMSYYEEIAVLNKEHGVTLVQHKESGRVFVKKTLDNYDLSVFRNLQKHPIKNTPYIYDLIEEQGQLTVIEEYLSGVPLMEIIEEKTHLDENEAVSIFSKVCQIVNDLHQAEPPIIHRDIKPSNIIITPDDQVKLIDMDAAKHVHKSAAQDTVLLGTQGYAAPEQYGFASSDTRTDIYSLGVLLNILLTGNLPRQEIARGKYGQIITKSTDMNPSERYGSITELLSAVCSVESELTSYGAKRGARKYILPGFRSGNIVNNLIAILGYGIVILMSTILTVKSESYSILLLNRITVFVSGFLIILFTCNYLDVWKKLGIARIRNKWLKIAVIVAADAVIFLVCILMLAIVETAVSS